MNRGYLTSPKYVAVEVNGLMRLVRCVSDFAVREVQNPFEIMSEDGLGYLLVGQRLHNGFADAVAFELRIVKTLPLYRRGHGVQLRFVVKFSKKYPNALLDEFG